MSNQQQYTTKADRSEVVFLLIMFGFMTGLILSLFFAINLWRQLFIELIHQ